MSAEHLTATEIEAYIGGELVEQEREKITAHLEQCDECLDEVDLHWNTQDVFHAQNEQKAKEKLFNKIHRSHLLGNFIGLGVNMFFNISMLLLSPLLRLFTLSVKKEK